MLIKLLDESYLNNEVVISGWIQTIRSQKNLTFIKLTDNTTAQGIQLIVENNQEKLYTGTSIKVKGILVDSPAKGQKYEIQVIELKVIGQVDPEEYPLLKGKLSLTYLRNYPHLRFRTNTFGAVFRIKSAISFATSLFFNNKNYLHLDPNIITTNECEGGAGVFQLTENTITDIEKLPINKETKKYDWTKDHFDKPVFLTVSSQLQLEAISCSMGGVYTINKSFRSEHSNTTKHLSEFTHLEIENTFIDLDYLMDISEEYIKYIGNYLIKNNTDDLLLLDSFASKGIFDKINTIINTNFVRIDYSDAINLLNISNGNDLSSENENYLTEYYNAPVFVKNWPSEIKSFYMKQNDDGTVSNFDLLMPYKVGELIGGSMREENYDKLISMMKVKDIDPKSMEFYLDLRKYGTVPHGGFGLGIDRLCMLMTGMENIKDTVPFPVYYKSCDY